jgi:isopentenyl diphosphate isomerase/L-lactate dehydrogenase-like FMN-dependent dehydrogenase
VRRTLDIFADETTRTMQLVGVDSLDDMDTSKVRLRSRPRESAGTWATPTAEGVLA